MRDDDTRDAEVVSLEQAIEAGDLAEDLAELTIGQVPIRDLMVEDDDDDDPMLLSPDGRPVDTWREGYPYDERLRATTTSATSGCCRSSCSSCRTG